MSLVQWNETLSVGVPSLDAEHKQLVALVNRLHDAMINGSGKAALHGVLQELVQYTQTHFKHEEELMSRTAYPQAAVHKLQHDQLTKKVLDLQNQVQQGKVSITIEVMNFLKSWLQDHILKMDKAYTQHFTSKGIR